MLSLVMGRTERREKGRVWGGNRREGRKERRTGKITEGGKGKSKWE